MLPQLDPTYYISQIFWLFISFSLLYFLLSRNFLPKIKNVIQDRFSRINNDLEKSKLLREEAEEVKGQYHKSLQLAKEEADAIIKQAMLTIDENSKLKYDKLSDDIAVKISEADAKIEAMKFDLSGSTDLLKELITTKISARLIG